MAAGVVHVDAEDARRQLRGAFGAGDGCHGVLACCEESLGDVCSYATTGLEGRGSSVQIYIYIFFPLPAAIYEGDTHVWQITALGGKV